MIIQQKHIESMRFSSFVCAIVLEQFRAQAARQTPSHALTEVDRMRINMAEPISHKTCSACKRTLAIGNFSPERECRDGYRAQCKGCRAVYNKARYDANREALIAKVRAWQAANPEKEKARGKARYAENSEAIKAKLDAFCKDNPEHKRETRKAYRLANRDREKAKMKAWQVANPDRVRANQHKRRARLLQAAGQFRPEDIAALRDRQKDKCAHAWCCVKLNRRGEVDHIIALSRGGSNDRHNLQLLCSTCNRSKGAKHPIAHAQRNGFLL